MSITLRSGKKTFYGHTLVTMQQCRMVILLIIVLLSAGCANDYPHLKVLKSLPAGADCRMAVLPFGYHGDYPRGAAIVTKAFSARLAANAGIDVMSEGNVLQFYRQFKLYPKDQLDHEKIRMLAQRLNAQYVIAGDILQIIEIDVGGKVDTVLSMVVNIHDGASGELLWNTYHKRNGEEYRNVLHYGGVNSLSGLSRRMADEIVQLWIKNGMHQCAH